MLRLVILPQMVLGENRKHLFPWVLWKQESQTLVLFHVKPGHKQDKKIV